MYNLTVAEAHTFFVGDGQWLVHNACRKYAPTRKHEKGGWGTEMDLSSDVAQNVLDKGGWFIMHVVPIITGRYDKLIFLTRIPHPGEVQDR